MQRDGARTSSYATINYWGSTAYEIEAQSKSVTRYCEENAASLYELAMDCYNGGEKTTQWTWMETEQISAGRAGTPTEIRPNFDPERVETLTPFVLNAAPMDRDPALLMTLKVRSCPDDYPFGDHLILYQDASGDWKKLTTVKLLEEQTDGRAVTYRLQMGGVSLSEITALAGPIPLEADEAAKAEIDASFYYGVTKS